MFKNKTDIVLKEISSVLGDIDGDQIDDFIREIRMANKIIVIGAGRMGLVAKAFAMRLMHLGMEVYTLNDCNLPRLEKGDLLVVCSGSGETQTIYDLVVIVKDAGIKIFTITANPSSRIGKLSDFIVEIKAPSKKEKVSLQKSVQPMTTLMEQSLFLFFDALVLELIDKMNIDLDWMKNRHSILE